MTDHASEHVDSALDKLKTMIEQAPDADMLPRKPGTTLDGGIHFKTGVPKRYRANWHRPDNSDWVGKFDGVCGKVKSGGIVSLIGPRGTGKTRLACECMRDIAPELGLYTTAMGLFLRLRATYQKNSTEAEVEVVELLSKAKLLVIDEIQERGNSAWEDRLLTHILDKRYGALLPTIVVANLTEAALAECLGDSIVSRLQETGGVLHVDGKSHRSM